MMHLRTSDTTCAGRPQLSTRVVFWLLSLVVLSNLVALVRAQSSCSTPQVISAAPTTINPGLIQSSNGGTSSYDICQAIDFSSSTLQVGTGLWFSYTPNTTKIVHVFVKPVDVDGSPPDFLILKGSCDSLRCEEEAISNEVHFQAEPDVEYLIYIFRSYQYVGEDAFTFTLEEIEPPINDNIENAIPLTHQDLPYQAEFTTYGALSDFNEDACGLDGEYGIWFSYTTTLSTEYLTLEVTTGNTADVVGIQRRAADGWVCEYIGSSFGSDLEWMASSNVEYYILVGDPEPAYAGAFEFTLQSRSYLDSPTSALSPEAPASPAPVASEGSDAPIVSPLPTPAVTPQPTPAVPPQPPAGTNDATGNDGNDANSVEEAAAAPPASEAIHLTTEVYGAGLGLGILFLILV